VLVLEASTSRLDELRRKIVEHDAAIGFGVAFFPREGTTADALIERARASARPSAERASGGPLLRDQAMLDLYRLAEKVARGKIAVLLLGETGSGKEVLAAHVHARSTRSGGPYLKLNCGALTETLLESELFGYEKGAFTGAERAKPGLLEEA